MDFRNHRASTIFYLLTSKEYLTLNLKEHICLLCRSSLFVKSVIKSGLNVLLLALFKLYVKPPVVLWHSALQLVIE